MRGNRALPESRRSHGRRASSGSCRSHERHESHASHESCAHRGSSERRARCASPAIPVRLARVASRAQRTIPARRGPARKVDRHARPGSRAGAPIAHRGARARSTAIVRPARVAARRCGVKAPRATRGEVGRSPTIAIGASIGRTTPASGTRTRRARPATIGDESAGIATGRGPRTSGCRTRGAANRAANPTWVDRLGGPAAELDRERASPNARARRDGPSAGGEAPRRATRPGPAPSRIRGRAGVAPGTRSSLGNKAGHRLPGVASGREPSRGGRGNGVHHAPFPASTGDPPSPARSSATPRGCSS